MARNKYGNMKTQVDGYTFDSKAEAKRYGELKLLERAGQIRPKSLIVHPTWVLMVNYIKVATYEADFQYNTTPDGDWMKTLVVEDVKGVKTATYRIKKKLMKAIHGIDIQEVIR